MIPNSALIKRWTPGPILASALCLQAIGEFGQHLSDAGFINRFGRLQIDDETGVLIGLVSHAADLGDDFFVRELGDLLFELRAVHVVRDLGDDDLLAVAIFDDFSLIYAAPGDGGGFPWLPCALGGPVMFLS